MTTLRDFVSTEVLVSRKLQMEKGINKSRYGNRLFGYINIPLKLRLTEISFINQAPP
jgi:hypothetical protein